MSTSRKRKMGFRVYRYNRVRTGSLEGMIDADETGTGKIYPTVTQYI